VALVSSWYLRPETVATVMNMSFPEIEVAVVRSTDSDDNGFVPAVCSELLDWPSPS
jgi:hypothetical protein